MSELTAEKQELLNGDLIHACVYNDLIQAKNLVKQGAQVNCFKLNTSPLKAALMVEEAELEVVKFLVEENGVDVNAKDGNGITVLMDVASFPPFLEVMSLKKVNYLLEKGANSLDEASWPKLTARDFATNSGNEKVAAVLLVAEKKAKKELRNKFNKKTNNEPNVAGTDLGLDLKNIIK